MNAFEQSNMNMIAHNRVLPEVGSYILQVERIYGWTYK
jgi:hypothetical protein